MQKKERIRDKLLELGAVNPVQRPNNNKNLQERHRVSPDEKQDFVPFVPIVPSTTIV